MKTHLSDETEQSTRSASDRLKPFLKREWRQALFSVRTRLLLWYFFLASCTATISISAAYRIYCEAISTRADSAIDRQLDQFELYVETKRQVNKLPTTTAGVLDGFLKNYAPTNNEYVITLLNGKFHSYQSYANQPITLLQQRPDMIAKWSQISSRHSDSLSIREQHFRYAVVPFRLSGDLPGTVVVLYNSTFDFQQGRQALLYLIRDVLIFLVISFVLAWITVGRVLFPLRLVTKTAQSITESDMTQRIPVRGKDEIAVLTATFNDMLNRLQTAFDSQKEFLKDVSHELRTPVTVIQGHLETLKYHPETQEETIALLMDELERMSRLVNDLLLLAKTEHPDFLHFRPEELDWLTEELYLKSRPLADRKWQLESKGLSPIVVDRQRITQAVMNLVQNAIRHTEAGDTITLGSAVKENHAYLWVRDTGEGIAPEDQQRIFERFVRATNCDTMPGKRARRFEGHGLGLSIVQAIAYAHGGWVELSSRLGYGSTFTIVILLEPALISASYESDSDRRRQSPHQLLPGDRTSSKRLYHHRR
ncbi:HAMP domain-containing protein [Phormidium tenue FACHB-886]|nr:HAMP domain-containing protein [Phormidium tenue FACHB-886]